MDIPELREHESLALLWVNNVYHSKDAIGNSCPFVNCTFYSYATKKSIFKKIAAAYLPHLMPGTVWKMGKISKRVNTKFTLKFVAPTQKYTTSQIKAELELDSSLFKSFYRPKLDKSFFYIPSKFLQISSKKNSSKNYKGLIIPRSAIAIYYFINSDNFLSRIIDRSRRYPFDETRSAQLSAELNKEVMALDDNDMLISDQSFWFRILKNDLFRTCFENMRDDCFFKTFNRSDKFQDAFLESNFPFASEVCINAYCREIKGEYLLLDTITKHDYEWAGYEDYSIYTEDGNQNNDDKGAVKDSGHNRLKEYDLGNDVITDDNKYSDPELKSQKVYIKFGDREEIIPRGNRLSQAGKVWNSSTSYVKIEKVDTVTVNDNVQSGSNIPKKDIINSEGPTSESPLNAIGKIVFIKEQLENLHHYQCQFIAPFKDPHGAHSEHITVFPPMHLIPNVKKLSNYKWMSRRKVPLHSRIIERKPSTGYGVLLRGAAVLEIIVGGGFFYLLEFEPGGSEPREFRTFLVCIKGFGTLNIDELELLLTLMACAEGKHRESVFEESIFIVNSKKFSPNLTEKDFADKISQWINDVKLKLSETPSN